MEKVWRKLFYGSLRRRQDCWWLKKKERAATSWDCGSLSFLLYWVWGTPRDITSWCIYTSPSARPQSSSIKSSRWECKVFHLLSSMNILVQLFHRKRWTSNQYVLENTPFSCVQKKLMQLPGSQWTWLDWLHLAKIRRTSQKQMTAVNSSQSHL